MRPEPEAIGAGPTAVHWSRDRGSVGFIWKMRKLELDWSATGSPRPEVGSGFSKLSDQLLRVAVVPPALVMTSCHVPPESNPRNPLKLGACGSVRNGFLGE